MSIRKDCPSKRSGAHQQVRTIKRTFNRLQTDTVNLCYGCTNYATISSPNLRKMERQKFKCQSVRIDRPSEARAHPQVGTIKRTFNRLQTDGTILTYGLPYLCGYHFAIFSEIFLMLAKTSFILSLYSTISFSSPLISSLDI